jgi:serine/threonine-protein kinase
MRQRGSTRDRVIASDDRTRDGTNEDVGTPEAPTAGTLVADKYRVECVLAQSEQSMLLAAWDEVLERPVALKLLPSVRQPRRVTRFVREARVVANIESDHVVRILDVGTMPNGSPFMVLERLDGCDLGGLLERDGPMTPQRIADLMLQACEGLAHAHTAGVVHRDIKPGNLFLSSRADGTAVVKLLDFGIAKRDAAPAEEHDVTRTMALLGSPTYMSPEQIDAAKNVDARSDIWSLGVVIYKLATGRAPFKGDSLAILASEIQRGVIPPSSMPPELERIVHRCLQRDREARYPSVLELARDLAPLATARGEQLVPRIAFLFGVREAVSAETRVAPQTVPPMHRPPPSRAPIFVIAFSILGLAALTAFVLHRRSATAQASAATDPPPIIATTTAPTATVTTTATPPVTATAEEPSSDPPDPKPRTAAARDPRRVPAARPPSPPPPPPAAPASSLPKVLGGRI